MKISEFNNYSAKKNKIIYLAVPYTAKEVYLQNVREQKVTYLSARMAEHGIYSISPITQSHQQQLHVPLPHTWDFWETCDYMLLDRSDELWVYMLPGWIESVGVQAEIAYAKKIKIPIRYVRVEGDEITGQIYIETKSSNVVQLHKNKKN
jgi:hypothetical protein